MIIHSLKQFVCGTKLLVRFLRKTILLVIVLLVLLLISQYINLQAVVNQKDWPSRSNILQLVLESASPSTNPAPVHPEKKRVLLLTYERSGSSFTADIIAAHRTVFYTFEPLLPTCVKYTGKDILITDNGIKKRGVKRNMTAYTIEARDVVRSFLNCTISHLPFHVIKNPLFKVRNYGLGLYTCVKNLHKHNVTSMDCVKAFERKCKEKQVSLVKTIRYPTWSLQSEMAADPQMYLIYLVRDPRGMINSQIVSMRNFNWIHVGRASSMICRFIDRDLQMIIQIQKLYPHRVKIVRYETIAFEPLRRANEIYKFIGLGELSDSVKSFITKHTESNSKGGAKVFNTLRKNSKAIPYKWRSRSTLNAVRKIDKSCSVLYEKLCYRPVNSLKNLRNMSYPLIEPCELNRY